MRKLGWIALIVVSTLALVGVAKRSQAATIGTVSDLSKVSIPYIADSPVVEELGTAYFEILGAPMLPLTSDPTSAITKPKPVLAQPVGARGDIIVTPFESREVGTTSA